MLNSRLQPFDHMLKYLLRLTEQVATRSLLYRPMEGVKKFLHDQQTAAVPGTYDHHFSSVSLIT